jgi:hypothetical protein
MHLQNSVEIRFSLIPYTVSADGFCIYLHAKFYAHLSIHRFMATINPELLEQIKLHAVGYLSPVQGQQTNLSVNKQIFEKGEHIGPPVQRIVADERTVLVFADDDPLANWGHACRYLLYNPDTGAFQKEIQARLPSGRLEPFHTPVQIPKRTGEPIFFWPPLRPRCPIIIPEGNRYALLYAGFTMERHLNDLEFCYRTLINVYAIPPENIIVLSFDGTMTVVNDDWSGTSAAPALWPGDGTPYQLPIGGQGTFQGLQTAFGQLASKMKPKDLLFIHTNNHGDTDNTGAYIGYPGSFPSGNNVDWSLQWVNLYASAFANLLGTLPAYRALVVMMEQCGSGGFGPDILGSSTASATSFSAACLAWASSYIATYLGAPWDGFAYQWIAAMAGAYPNGSALISNPDTDGSFVVDSNDAFNYALANGLSADSPNTSSSGANAGKLVLAEEYNFYWIWCWFWTSFTQPFYEAVLKRKITPAVFYQKLNEAVPALQKSIIAESDKTLLDLRHKLAPQIKKALEASFNAKD